MNQHSFIKYFFLFRWCLLLVLSSFISSQEFFTRNQLIGKGNPDIIGNSKMHKEVEFAFEKIKQNSIISSWKDSYISSGNLQNYIHKYISNT